MKQSKRILAYSALALIVMLAAFGAIAFDTSNVAHAQTVGVPTLTAQASGATTINLTWTAVDDAARYELWVWDSENEWQQIGGNSLTGTTYPHAGLTEGTTYYYQIRAITADGSNYGWSTRVNEVAGMAPDAPSLTATAGYLQITVSWPDVTGAARYELWAWDGSWTALHTDADPITGTSHTHEGLTAGRTYYYQGRSVDTGGTMSAWSAQTSAEVLSTPNISAPTSFSAARGDGMITLTWSAPSNLAGLTISRYDYRSRESGGAFGEWMDAGNDGAKTITGLANGTMYDFELRAVSTTGAEGATASASGTPSTVPDAPTLTATAGYQRIVLSWTAPADNGAAVTSYRIERENDDGTWGNPRSVPGSSTLTTTFTGLTNATEYTYRIFAVNVAGDSDWTSASAITLANPVQVPGPPTGLTTTSGPGMVTLKWSEPVFNGGAAVTSYRYRYTKADPISWTGWFSTGADTEVEISPLDPGVEYDFEVTATNSAGTGTAAEASETPAATAPTAAPSLTVVLSKDSGDTNNREQIRIEYRNIKDSKNGGATVTGYQLQWKADDGDWAETDANFTAASPAANFSEDVLITRYHPQTGQTALEPGTVYTYRVRAFNNADNTGDSGQSPLDRDGDGDLVNADQVEENGPWSAELSVKTAAIAPSVPVLNPLAGTAGTDEVPAIPAWTIDINSITVRWTEPADGGSPITSYQLEVRNDPDDPNETNTFTMPDPDDNQATVDRTGNTRISNLPASRLWYTHSGLKASSVYYYRIRALNDADGDGRPGEEGEVSDWSGASDDVTTLGASLGTHVAPASITVTAGDGALAHRIVVTWPLPLVGEDDTLSPVTRYEIQWQQSDEATEDEAGWADAETLVPTPPTNRTLDHDNREGDKRYVYRVRAINSAGNSPWSPVNAAETPARAPGAIMLTATPVGATEILLQWNQPAGNGTVFTSYQIQRWDPNANTGDGAWTDDIDIAGAGTTAYTDRGGDHNDDDDTDDPGEAPLMAGTTYSYRIRAEGGSPGAPAFSGTTVDSAMASATTSTVGTPGAPTLSAASGKDAGSITLTIGATTGATSLELQRWYGGSWSGITAPALDATSYTDSGLNAGDKYYYALRATNAHGTSPWSDVVNAIATAGNPDTPTLTATAESPNSIRLSWNVPANNGTAITGYQIQKWNDNAGNWTTTGEDELPTGNDSTYTATQGHRHRANGRRDALLSHPRTAADYGQ